MKYKDKDGNIKDYYINANEVQLLDVEGKFKNKNLEDALKEIGGGNEQNIKNIEDKVLKDEFTKLETDKSLTKLDNSMNVFVRNMQIRGKTLQNEFNRPSSINIPSSVTLNGTEYTTSTNSPQFIREICLKANTKYTCTFLAKGDSNGTSEATGFFRVDNADGIVNNGYVGNINTSYSNKNFNFTTDKHGVVKFNCRNAVAGITQMWVKDIIVLEGDYTNKEIPEYFEGIKSTGEAEGNKISILTRGKNLVDLTKLQDSIVMKINEITKNSVTLEQIVDNRGYILTPLYIKFKPNVKYILSAEILSDNTGLRIYDLHTETQYATLSTSGSIEFTPKEGIMPQLLFYTSLDKKESIGKKAVFKNIQIEEGTTVTSYEEYKEDKTEILTGNEPLRGLPNGVSDIVDFDKNERTRNVGKVVLDPKWYWNRTAVDINTPNTIEFQFTYPNMNGNSLLICDKFNCQEVGYLWLHDIEGIGANPSKNIQIRILKTKLETPDANGFKKWLQANPTTVYYQLAEPVIEKLNIKDTLQTFKDGYIQLDNAITPSTHLEYSTNIPSAIAGLTENVDKLVDDKNNILNELYNPNLLDNGDFIINTMGLREYSNNYTECLNKWILSKDIGKIISHDGYVELTGAGNSQIYIAQYKSEGDLYKTSGKKVTLSCELKVNNMKVGGIFFQIANDNKVFHKEVFSKDDLNNQWEKKYFTIEIPSDIKDYRIEIGSYYDATTGYIGIVNSDCSIFIKNVKLELGDTPTKFIPKSYEEEFNNCVPYRNVISNPNLLINADFQVWQRGTSFDAIDVSYTADRWLLASPGGAKVQNNNNRLQITLLNDSTYANLIQIIEHNMFKKLVGNTVTLTFKLSEKTNVVSQLWALEHTNPAHYYSNKSFNDGVMRDTFTMTFRIPNNTENAEVGIQMLAKKGNSITIEYAKLELGSVSTPFTPRLYTEEEILCKRYYQSIICNGVPIGGSTTSPTKNLSIHQTFPLNMRQTPTIRVVEDKVYDHSSNSDVPFVFSSGNIGFDSIGNIVSKEATLYQGKSYGITLLLDAEII